MAVTPVAHGFGDRATPVAGSVDERSGRLAGLDGLRGFAALAVVFYHVWGAHDGVVREGWFASVASYGWIGVPIFFVLSGYVIALSTQSAPAGAPSALRFLARRYVRVGLPLIAAAILSWAPWWLSYHLIPSFNGPAPPALTAAMVLCHFTASCEFVGEPWLNGVFWTLSIELQFYLIWAVVVAVRARVGAWVAIVGLVASIGVARYPSHVHFVHFVALFGLGIWLWYAGRHRVAFAPKLVVGALLTIAVAWTVGLPDAIAAAATALVIERAGRTIRPLGWLGAISYSLYLTHMLVTLRVHNLAGRFVDPQAWQWPVDLAGVVVAIAFAWVFFQTIERPALRLSNRMRSS